MALSSAPLFLAKLPVGFLSGFLLQKYCPETLEEGEVRHSKQMWWIIGLMTIGSPICITIFWKYISGEEYSHNQFKNSRLSGFRDEGEDDDEGDESESYQDHPLTRNISLPRVVSPENILT